MTELASMKKEWYASNNIKNLDTGAVEDATLDVINTVMFVKTVATKAVQRIYYGSKKLATNVANLFTSRPVVKTIVKNETKLERVNNAILTDGERKGLMGIRGKIELNTPKGMGRNKDTIINGRKYWGHILDRMQDRGIPLSAVENCIKNGKRLPAHSNRIKYYDSTNKLSVVVEKETGDLVSVTFETLK